MMLKIQVQLDRGTTSNNRITPTPAKATPPSSTHLFKGSFLIIIFVYVVTTQQKINALW